MFKHGSIGSIQQVNQSGTASQNETAAGVSDHILGVNQEPRYNSNKNGNGQQSSQEEVLHADANLKTNSLVNLSSTGQVELVEDYEENQANTKVQSGEATILQESKRGQKMARNMGKQRPQTGKNRSRPAQFGFFENSNRQGTNLNQKGSLQHFGAIRKNQMALTGHKQQQFNSLRAVDYPTRQNSNFVPIQMFSMTQSVSQRNNHVNQAALKMQHGRMAEQNSRFEHNNRENEVQNHPKGLRQRRLQSARLNLNRRTNNVNQNVVVNEQKMDTKPVQLLGQLQSTRDFQHKQMVQQVSQNPLLEEPVVRKQFAPSGTTTKRLVSAKVRLEQQTQNAAHYDAIPISNILQRPQTAKNSRNVQKSITNRSQRPWTGKSSAGQDDQATANTKMTIFDDQHRALIADKLQHAHDQSYQITETKVQKNRFQYKFQNLKFGTVVETKAKQKKKARKGAVKSSRNNFKSMTQTNVQNKNLYRLPSLSECINNKILPRNQRLIQQVYNIAAHTNEAHIDQFLRTQRHQNLLGNQAHHNNQHQETSEGINSSRFEFGSDPRGNIQLEFRQEQDDLKMLGTDRQNNKRQPLEMKVQNIGVKHDFITQGPAPELPRKADIKVRQRPKTAERSRICHGIDIFNNLVVSKINQDKRVMNGSQSLKDSIVHINTDSLSPQSNMLPKRVADQDKQLMIVGENSSLSPKKRPLLDNDGMQYPGRIPSLILNTNSTSKESIQQSATQRNLQESHKRFKVQMHDEVQNSTENLILCVDNKRAADKLIEVSNQSRQKNVLNNDRQISTKLQLMEIEQHQNGDLVTHENHNFHVVSAEQLADGPAAIKGVGSLGGQGGVDEENFERESAFEQPLTSSPEGVCGFLKKNYTQNSDGRGGATASRNISNLRSSDMNRLGSDKQLQKLFEQNKELERAAKNLSSGIVSPKSSNQRNEGSTLDFKKLPPQVCKFFKEARSVPSVSSPKQKSFDSKINLNSRESISSRWRQEKVKKKKKIFHERVPSMHSLQLNLPNYKPNSDENVKQILAADQAAVSDQDQGSNQTNRIDEASLQISATPPKDDKSYYTNLKSSASKNAKRQELIVVRDAGTGPMQQDGEQTPLSEALSSGGVYVVGGPGANQNNLILFEDEMKRLHADLNQQVRLVNNEENGSTLNDPHHNRKLFSVNAALSSSQSPPGQQGPQFRSLPQESTLEIHHKLHSINAFNKGATLSLSKDDQGDNRIVVGGSNNNQNVAAGERSMSTVSNPLNHYSILAERMKPIKVQQIAFGQHPNVTSTNKSHYFDPNQYTIVDQELVQKEQIQSNSQSPNQRKRNGRINSAGGKRSNVGQQSQGITSGAQFHQSWLNGISQRWQAEMKMIKNGSQANDLQFVVDGLDFAVNPTKLQNKSFPEYKVAKKESSELKKKRKILEEERQKRILNSVTLIGKQMNLNKSTNKYHNQKNHENYLKQQFLRQSQDITEVYKDNVSNEDESQQQFENQKGSTFNLREISKGTVPYVFVGGEHSGFGFTSQEHNNIIFSGQNSPKRELDSSNAKFMNSLKIQRNADDSNAIQMLVKPNNFGANIIMKNKRASEHKLDRDNQRQLDLLNIPNSYNEQHFIGQTQGEEQMLQQNTAEIAIKVLSSQPQSSVSKKVPLNNQLSEQKKLEDSDVIHEMSETQEAGQKIPYNNSGQKDQKALIKVDEASSSVSRSQLQLCISEGEDQTSQSVSQQSQSLQQNEQPSQIITPPIQNQIIQVQQPGEVITAIDEETKISLSSMKVVQQQNLPESNRNIRSVYEVERDAMKRGLIKPFSGSGVQSGVRDKTPPKKENMDLKPFLKQDRAQNQMQSETQTVQSESQQVYQVDKDGKNSQNQTMPRLEITSQSAEIQGKLVKNNQKSNHFPFQAKQPHQNCKDIQIEDNNTKKQGDKQRKGTGSKNSIKGISLQPLIPESLTQMSRPKIQMKTNQGNISQSMNLNHVQQEILNQQSIISKAQKLLQDAQILKADPQIVNQKIIEMFKEKRQKPAETQRGQGSKIQQVNGKSAQEKTLMTQRTGQITIRGGQLVEQISQVPFSGVLISSHTSLKNCEPENVFAKKAKLNATLSEVDPTSTARKPQTFGAMSSTTIRRQSNKLLLNSGRDTLILKENLPSEENFFLSGEAHPLAIVSGGKIRFQESFDQNSQQNYTARVQQNSIPSSGQNYKNSRTGRNRPRTAHHSRQIQKKLSLTHQVPQILFENNNDTSVREEDSEVQDQQLFQVGNVVDGSSLRYRTNELLKQNDNHHHGSMVQQNMRKSRQVARQIAQTAHSSNQQSLTVKHPNSANYDRGSQMTSKNHQTTKFVLSSQNSRTQGQVFYNTQQQNQMMHHRTQYSQMNFSQNYQKQAQKFLISSQNEEQDPKIAHQSEIRVEETDNQFDQTKEQIVTFEPNSDSKNNRDLIPEQLVRALNQPLTNFRTQKSQNSQFQSKGLQNKSKSRDVSPLTGTTSVDYMSPKGAAILS